jgi:serine/threonine protein kinase
MVAWPDDVLVANSAWYAANTALAERLFVSLTEAYVFCRDSTLACASASPSEITTRWPRVLAVNAYMDVVFDDKTAFGAAPPNLLNNYRTNIRALGLAAVPTNLSASFVDGSIDGTLAAAARITSGIDEADSRTAHIRYAVPYCSFQLRVGPTAAPCGTLFDDIDFVIPPPLPPATSYVPGPPLTTREPIVTIERLSDGEIAGIVVGSVLAFCLLLGLVGFVYLRGQRKLAAQHRHLEEAQAELEQRARDSAQMTGDAVKIATAAFTEASPDERQSMATFAERRQWRAAPELGYGDTPVSLDLLPLRVSATQLTFGIGAQGGRLVQATAGQQLVQRITLSNPSDAPQAVAWELVPVPANFLYSLTFTPSSGTLQPGEEVVFTAKLISFAVKKIRFTTALLLPDFKQFIDLKMAADVGIGQLLDPSELQYANEPVSQGSAGAIYEGLWRGQHVAIKKFKQQEQLVEEIPTNGSLWAEYMLEVRMLSRLRHKKVVGFVGSVIVPMHMCIVTEWIPNGSLQTAVHTYSINAGLKGKLILDVIDALRYCHQNQILHRDVKPSNVLIESFAINAAVNCKLGDFGSSREDRTATAVEKEAAEKEAQSALGEALAEDAPADDFTKGVGTPVFMAPEIFRYEPHTTKSDMYSFGLLVYSTFLETSPWHKESKAYNVASKVKKGRRPPLPKGDAEQLEASDDESVAESAALPACVRALVIKCWAQEQADRPSADDAHDVIVAWFASQSLVEPMPAVLREGARIPKSMFVTTGGAMSASKQQLNMTSGSTESTGGAASQNKTFLVESRDISVEDLMATARGEEALTAPPRKNGKKARRDEESTETDNGDEEYESSEEQEAEYSSGSR